MQLDATHYANKNNQSWEVHLYKGSKKVGASASNFLANKKKASIKNKDVGFPENDYDYVPKGKYKIEFVNNRKSGDLRVTSYCIH